jgi:hypothetical protein
MCRLENQNLCNRTLLPIGQAVIASLPVWGGDQHYVICTLIFLEINLLLLYPNTHGLAVPKGSVKNKRYLVTEAAHCNSLKKIAL